MSDRPINPLDMSDEDFLKTSGPPEPEPAAEIVADDKAVVEEEEVEAKTEAEIAADAVDNGDDEDADTSADKEDKSAEGETGDVDDDAAATAAADKSKADVSTEAKADEVKSEAKTELDATALGAFYNDIMTPFKANGKTIEVRTPEEAKQLMQMGANYTRKMQELAPHRKILTMLQNNDLLNEDKLSYLIDLDKKNPDAVKKLIKDSGVDPLDVDTEGSDYVGSNHSVSDEEVEFRTTLDELSSDKAGKETLVIINSQWDEASKEILWSKPEVMTAIHTQRELGLYDKIANEVARRKTIGMIDAKIPFLQAYTETGDEMARAALGTNGQTDDEEQTGKPELKPVATRTATPKSGLKNNDKAAAASPSRSAPASAKVISNPLAMSDEEFIKVNSLRV